VEDLFEELKNDWGLKYFPESVSCWGQDLNVRQADRANKTRQFEVSERI
jgi:hypothetical protein